MKRFLCTQRNIALALVFAMIMGMLSPVSDGVKVYAEDTTHELDGAILGSDINAELEATGGILDLSTATEPAVEETINPEDYVFPVSYDNVKLSSNASTCAITVDFKGAETKLPEGAYFRVDYKKVTAKKYKSIITNQNMVVIGDLKQITEYNIKVVTVFSDGKSTEELLKDTDMLSVTTLPYSVKNLRTSEIYNTEIDLKWEANAATASGITYNIYMSTDNVTYYFYTNTADNSIFIPDLAQNTTYYFRVAATVNVTDSNGNQLTLESTQEAIGAVTTNAAALPNVLNLVVTDEKVAKIELDWSALAGANKYKIFRKRASDTVYKFLGKSKKSEYTDKTVDSGEIYTYKVIAVNTATGAEGGISEVVAVAKPRAVTDMKYSCAATSVAISWTPQGAYTGFLIYRYTADTKKYVLYATTNQPQFTDINVETATNYRYAVRAYSFNGDHFSAQSDLVKIATTPASPVITVKGGALKNRIKWKKIARATGYLVYEKDVNGNFNLIQKIEGRTNISTVIKDRVANINYTYAVSAYKTAFSKDFISARSTEQSGLVLDKIVTNTDPYTFATKKKLIKSAGWKVVKNIANYKNSITIPGLKTTNCDGYLSTNMCPQGFCIAKKFAIISAYDKDKEENSVLYVINKNNKKLKTVISLPDSAHVGGLCFDGEYVWVTSTNAVAAISFDKIKACVQQGDATSVENDYYCTSLTTASYMAYHNEMLWIGTYDAESNGVLNAYYISRDSSSGEFLTKAFTMTMPSRVQGITFNGDYMIVSRAYSYTRQLDIYKPKKESKEKYALGTLLKTVNMPYLNEDMDICGNFLYVNFESAVSAAAPNKMDRVVALKLKKVMKDIKK
ncbi:MAG: hypothetical protein K6E43_01635 [Lachnospiraceae bacterium]|nr:hypothetical protein [Lachnospiraceae bacterium]